MTTSPTNKESAVDNKLLTLPANAGRAIVEAGALIACPLLGTNRFIDFCRKRGLSINRKRLIRLERLGLFAPFFRVRTPKKDTTPFYIPVRKGNNWFTKRWAWDTTGICSADKVTDYQDQMQEGYYSIFQIDHLHTVLMQMTLQVQLDSYLDRNEEETIDWQENGERWLQYSVHSLEQLRANEYRRSVALLCQFISNRYFPKTQGDQRTIQVGGGHYSDQWISVNGFDWHWRDEIQNWTPSTTEQLFGITRAKLLHAYRGLAVSQAHCDPMERWHQLTQFVSVGERAKLKNDALRAETLRASAHMLRLLHKDLYEDELPNPNEVSGTVITHIPELAVRQDPRRYLEFVTNRFGLNPQPKLSLIVEGQSEEAAVLKIFERYFGVHPGVYGIEIIVLGSVDVATGSKKDDRFRAILRLIDYLHHHQTITFLMLDNENYAEKLKRESRKSKSIHSKQRYVTRPEYIRIWKDTFEFDNFSCTEIAAAMTELALGYVSFTAADVAACKKCPNPGSNLQKLYQEKASYGLQKIKLTEILIEDMVSPNSRRKIENRSIIKVLERVARLASLNHLPTMYETWEKNQASRYLGKKRRPER